MPSVAPLTDTVTMPPFTHSRKKQFRHLSCLTAEDGLSAVDHKHRQVPPRNPDLGAELHERGEA